MRPDTLLQPQAIESLLATVCNAPSGALVEVGVYRGGSAWHLAQLGRPLYLYDTFCGMPFHIPGLDGNGTGSFADTSLEEVARALPYPHVHLRPGIFPQSFLDDPIREIAFVHADADQYQTTADIIEVLGPRLVPGGMVLFDDYGVSGCEGCTRAVNERWRVTLLETGKALYTRQP